MVDKNLPKNANASFNKTLAFSLMSFAGYGLLITVILNLAFFVILPYLGLSLEGFLSSEDADNLPGLSQLAIQLKWAFTALSIFLFMLLLSSFFLVRGRKWGLLLTILLVILATLFVIIGIILFIQYWRAISGFPLPEWFNVAILAIMIGLALVLMVVIIKLLKSLKKINSSPSKQ